jgi:hypothetical protein
MVSSELLCEAVVPVFRGFPVAPLGRLISIPSAHSRSSLCQKLQGMCSGSITSIAA